MTAFAIIEDGRCVNIAEAEAEFAAEVGWVEIAEGFGIGDFYSDGAWSKPVQPLDERRAAMLASVNADRDRRMRLPFSFAGHTFDYDDASQKRITGAAALAGFALTLGGKLPGDLLWHGGGTPFVWIAADNQLVEMDAPMCFGLGQAAAAWESAHVFAAKALKNAIEAAEDHAALDAIDVSAGWPS